MSRKELIKKLGNKLLSITNSVKITKGIVTLIFAIIIFFSIALIIPILLLPFVIVGYYIETPKAQLHNINTKTSTLDDSKRTTDKNILSKGSFGV